MLIGTKADLKYECEDPITREKGERFAREINAVGYLETSAKTGEGVHKAIQMGIKAVLKDDEPYDLTSREGYGEQYKNKVYLHLAISRGRYDEVSIILGKVMSLEGKGR